MEFNTTFLLTKSFTYLGDFNSVNKEIISSLKKHKNNTISDRSSVDLFKSKHSGTEIVFKITNQFINSCKSNKIKLNKFNFVVYSMSRDIFKHHISQQIKDKIADLESEYKEKYRIIKEKYESGIIKTRYAKMVTSHLITICDKVPESVSKNSEATIEKFNEILKLLTYVSSEAGRKEIDDFSFLGDFIKVLRRFIDFLTLDLKNDALSRIKDLHIIVGKNNVLNISIVGTKDISVTEGTRDSEDFIARAYKDSNGINSILDNLSSLFDVIDINKLISCKEKSIGIQESNTSVKRVVFSKCLYDETFFKQIWSGRHNQVVNQKITNCKYYYSLMATNMAFYRSLPFTKQLEIVKDQIMLRQFSLKSCDLFVNHNIGVYDNFFVSNNTFVMTESAQTFIEKDALTKSYPNAYDYREWFLFKVVNNHRIRFGAFIDAEIICSAVVYSSMCIMAHSNFRNKLMRFSMLNNHLSRMLQAHNISREYSKMNLTYSMHGPFIKNEKNAMSQIVFEHVGLKALEHETDSLLRNVWQESNITNGKIFPFIQAFGSVVATICATIGITLNICNNKFGFTFSLVAASAIILTAVFSIIYYFASINYKK